MDEHNAADVVDVEADAPLSPSADTDQSDADQPTVEEVPVYRFAEGRDEDPPGDDEYVPL